MIIALQNKVSKYSRERKVDHFYSLYKDGESVLDAGVSAESGLLPLQNYFLKNFRYSRKLYTGLGVQDLSGMEALYPGRRFVQYPGGVFPFTDKEFDWVFSNAVIEHVGESSAQLLFLNEMMRVGKKVFFTTPNRNFPFESHTHIFFLHWNTQMFYKWCKKKKPWFFSHKLYLLNYRRLYELLKNSNASSFSIFKNRFIGIPMTFTVICTGGNTT
jgi:hypothetical protein